MLIFLQNAYSREYAGKYWPRKLWLKALSESRSGQKVKLLTHNLNDCENTSPTVGATPDSQFPADLSHIKKILSKKSPEIVIACGKQAETALADLWQGPLICIPHPACRIVTNQLYNKARELAEQGFTGRVALRQQKGQVIEEGI